MRNWIATGMTPCHPLFQRLQHLLVISKNCGLPHENTTKRYSRRFVINLLINIPCSQSCLEA